MVHKKLLEESLSQIISRCPIRGLSVGQLLQFLSGNGRYLLILLLAIPFCQPLQIPGTSLVFGLAISFIGFRSSFGKRILLPRALLEYTLSAKTIRLLSVKTLHALNKIDRYVHPRAIFITKWTTLHGVFFTFLGFALALPLPVPFSNLIAAWACAFLSLGIIKNDGLFIFISYALTAGVILILSAIFITAEKLFIG